VFNENLTIGNQAVLGLNSAVAPLPLGSTTGATVVSQTIDSVRTRNTFYGGQIGASVLGYWGPFFFSAQEKLGLGGMCQNATIDGATTTQVTTVADRPGTPIGSGSLTTVFPPTSTPGGLLIGPGGVGRHTRCRIAFLSDTNLKFGYVVCPWCRAHFGYDVLNVTNVVRPGGVSGLSTSTVSATVAGTGTTVSVAQPTFNFHDSTVLLQGINFGVEFLY
jgi:hypothetical protein